jgi:hypothetical protein
MTLAFVVIGTFGNHGLPASARAMAARESTPFLAVVLR